jgi:uncharacterized protein YggU (UPF0235/DUF167 family)
MMPTEFQSAAGRSCRRARHCVGVSSKRSPAEEDQALVKALTFRRSVRIPVLVSRMACGNELLGWQGGELKMRVVAGSEDGRDNDAVECMLSEVLEIERDRVEVVIGRGSRRKWVEIDDYDDDDLDRDLPGRYDDAADESRAG